MFQIYKVWIEKSYIDRFIMQKQEKSQNENKKI